MTVLTALLVLAQGTPVHAPVPSGVDASKPLKLVRAKDSKEVPVQLWEGHAYWMHEGDALDYRLEPGAASDFPKVECRDDGKHLLFAFKGKDIARYNYAVIDPPQGVAPVFARSGYVHPIWNPSGKVATNDHAPKHLHHHGLWFPWTSSEYDGRKVDFWNSAAKQGKVEFVKMDGSWSGPAQGGFQAKHRFIDLTAPGGPKTVLHETWTFSVHASADRYLFDLVSEQTCATDKPLVIKEYRYGGLGFRGSSQWEGKEGAKFLTSEGKGRVDGHATRAKWCLMTGKIDGKETSVGFLCHPSNFRFPQNMRIHPDEPFFNWAPSQAGDFQIEPGKPYLSRYRFVVADGELTTAEMDALFQAYAEPPKVSLAAK
jgi:hypothetical protein